MSRQILSMARRVGAVAVMAVLMVNTVGCESGRARGRLGEFRDQQRGNTEAWNAARNRLELLCPPGPPRANSARELTLRTDGPDSVLRCDFRFVKLSNGPQAHDWGWLWLPRYPTIVAVHEEELRKRVRPKVYDEYMLGLARSLADRVDRGDMTPQQTMPAFNQAWAWTFQQARTERVLLEDSVRVAERADAETWQALNNLAAGLALVVAVAAGVAVGVALGARSVAPPPLQCQAAPATVNAFTGQVTSVYVTCW